MRSFAFKALAVLLASCATVTTAWADHPRYLPQRDAQIVYRSDGSDPMVPQSLTMRYAAALDRLRIDGGPLGWLLVDRPHQRVELVMPATHLVIPMPQGAGLTRGFVLSRQLDFHRVGTDTVIGRLCTLYDVTSDGAHARVCLTADGLLLRGDGQGRDGRHAHIEAVSVEIAAQPADLFAPPAGYRSMAFPR